MRHHSDDSTADDGVSDEVVFDSSSDATTLDADEMAAALTVLDDFDADFGLFHALFDKPDDDALPPLPHAEVPMQDHGNKRTTSDRRRQRWHGSETMLASAHVQCKSAHGGDSFAREWEEMAKNQKRQREAAEKENVQLKKLLKSQKLATNRIFKLAQRAATLATAVSMNDACPYLGPSIDLEQLKSELDRLTGKSENMLTTGNFAALEMQFRNVQIRRCETETGDAIQIEVELAWVLPFNVEAVSTALWHSARAQTKETIFSTTVVHKDSELIVAHIVAGPKEEDGKSAVAHTQIATRRLPTREDGSVLLVVATHCQFVMGKSTWVGTADGEGYILVNSVPSQSSASQGPLTRVSWCRHSRAQPPAESKLSPAERSRWIDSAVSGPMRNTDKKIDRVIQAIENLLLSPAAGEVVAE